MINNLIELFAVIILSTLIYLDNTSFKVSKYQVKSNKLPTEFNKYKIIQLSDLHSCNYGKNNNKLIEKVHEENPDIIVMTGDMVNKYDVNYDGFLNLAEKLSGNYKIYYIVGNHEQRLKKESLDYILKKLKNLNVRILKNEKISIVRNKEQINIYDMEIPLKYYKFRNKPLNIDAVVNKALNKCNEEDYNILLAHNPLYFKEYAKYNVDLILSGHVHGGMIRLPYIGAILSPERKFFPKYSSGLYEINRKILIVSRGLGHSRFGVRLFNMPEMVSITLIK